MAARPTLVQLAKAAGVSLATVSRIVNGSGHVTENLRERVRKTARELGIDLQQINRSRSIVFVLSNRDMLHSFHSRILVGAQAQCAASGWDMLFLVFRYSADIPWKALPLPAILRRRDVARAVILAGSNSENLLTALKHRDTPYAVLGNNLTGQMPDHGSDIVFSDDIQGCYEMTRYLQSLGHTHIWYLGNCRLPWLDRGSKGYRRAMEGAGYTPHLQEFDSTDEQEIGYLGTKSIVSRSEAVTAIFAGTDKIAAGVYRAAADCGLSIPNDLTVTGCNDTCGDVLQPRLTTVREFPEQLGKRLVELCLSRLEQPDLPSRRVTIPTGLVKRESCHPVRVQEAGRAESRAVISG